MCDESAVMRYCAAKAAHLRITTEMHKHCKPHDAKKNDYKTMLKAAMESERISSFALADDADGTTKYVLLKSSGMVPLTCEMVLAALGRLDLSELPEPKPRRPEPLSTVIAKHVQRQVQSAVAEERERSGKRSVTVTTHKPRHRADDNGDDAPSANLLNVAQKLLSASHARTAAQAPWKEALAPQASTIKNTNDDVLSHLEDVDGRRQNVQLRHKESNDVQAFVLRADEKEVRRRVGMRSIVEGIDEIVHQYLEGKNIRNVYATRMTRMSDEMLEHVKVEFEKWYANRSQSTITTKIGFTKQNRVK